MSVTVTDTGHETVVGRMHLNTTRTGVACAAAALTQQVHVLEVVRQGEPLAVALAKAGQIRLVAVYGQPVDDAHLVKKSWPGGPLLQAAIRCARHCALYERMLPR
jgi:F0F1-type ATP synthase beta subunit